MYTAQYRIEGRKICDTNDMEVRAFVYVVINEQTKLLISEAVFKSVLEAEAWIDKVKKEFTWELVTP